jgi:hypothetical protein
MYNKLPFHAIQEIEVKTTYPNQPPLRMVRIGVSGLTNSCFYHCLVESLLPQLGTPETAEAYVKKQGLQVSPYYFENIERVVLKFRRDIAIWLRSPATSHKPDGVRPATAAEVRHNIYTKNFDYMLAYAEYNFLDPSKIKIDEPERLVSGSMILDLLSQSKGKEALAYIRENTIIPSAIATVDELYNSKIKGKAPSEELFLNYQRALGQGFNKDHLKRDFGHDLENYYLLSNLISQDSKDQINKMLIEQKTISAIIKDMANAPEDKTVVNSYAAARLDLITRFSMVMVPYAFANLDFKNCKTAEDIWKEALGKVIWDTNQLKYLMVTPEVITMLKSQDPRIQRRSSLSKGIGEQFIDSSSGLNQLPLELNFFAAGNGRVLLEPSIVSNIKTMDGGFTSFLKVVGASTDNVNSDIHDASYEDIIVFAQYFCDINLIIVRISNQTIHAVNFFEHNRDRPCLAILHIGNHFEMVGEIREDLENGPSVAASTIPSRGKKAAVLGESVHTVFSRGDPLIQILSSVADDSRKIIKSFTLQSKIYYPEDNSIYDALVAQLPPEGLASLQEELHNPRGDIESILQAVRLSTPGPLQSRFLSPSQQRTTISVVPPSFTPTLLENNVPMADDKVTTQNGRITVNFPSFINRGPTATFQPHFTLPRPSSSVLGGAGQQSYQPNFTLPTATHRNLPLPARTWRSPPSSAVPETNLPDISDFGYNQDDGSVEFDYENIPDNTVDNYYQFPPPSSSASRGSAFRELPLPLPSASGGRTFRELPLPIPYSMSLRRRVKNFYNKILNFGQDPSEVDTDVLLSLADQDSTEEIEAAMFVADNKGWPAFVYE